MLYGYTLARTQAGDEAGEAGQGITMLLYAGSRDGVHQLHQRSGTLIKAIQCSHPCEVMKVMTAGEGLGTINTEYFRIEPSSVAALAIRDAHHGHLKQYGLGEGRTRYSVWVDQDRGIVKTKLP